MTATTRPQRQHWARTHRILAAALIGLIVLAVSLLIAQFKAALSTPEVQAKLTSQGLYPAVVCGADFAAFLRQQHDNYARIVREANIRVE